MKESFFKSCCLLLCTIAVSVSFGLSYGIGNQNTYLINGLTIINPAFLKGDWFAHFTTHYHSNFSGIIFLLEYFGIPLRAGTIAIELVLRLIILYTIFKVINLLVLKNKSLIFILVLIFILITKTRSVGGSYIISNMLQPSSLGSCFTIIGFYYFFSGSFFLSGLFVSIGGFFHTNFLLLGFVYLGFAHLLLGPTDLFKRLFYQFSIMLIPFFVKLPFLLSMSSSEHSEKARFIFQFIRSPHHYVPKSYLIAFFPFYGFCLLGLAGLITMKRDEQVKKNFGLFVSLIITISFATAFTTVIFIPFVSQLFFWRMAPFCTMIGFILFLSANYQSKKEKISKKDILIYSLVITGSLFILRFNYYKYEVFSYNFLISSSFVLFVCLLFFKKRILNQFNKYLPENFNIIIISLFFVLVLVFSFKSDFINKSSIFNVNTNICENELYDWVKSVKKTAKFIIPPDLENFRLNAERAVIVDWKSTPIDPEGLIEWYTRINDIANIKNVKSLQEAKQGYVNNTSETLLSLKAKYSADYAVLYKNNNVPDIFEKVFVNETFVVIKL